MPAELLPDAAIPALAAQIDSPAMLRVLRHLRQVGFIQNGPDLDPATFEILQRLAGLQLVDPGYAESPTESQPFIWVRNHNGDRVLKHFEGTVDSKLKVHPRAHTALASLPERDQQAVLAAAEFLLTRDPAAWPRDLVERLSPDKPVYLLRVTDELRAFFTLLDSGGIELSDIVREDTLRLFLERYRAGSKAG
jgi:hypothetical protein